MKLIKLITIFGVMGILASCSSPQEKAAAAEEEKTQRRMELVDKYQKCMKENEGDKQKQEVCNSYLEASKALQ